MRFKPPPNERHVAVGLLKSAYLMVFSMLGREGYRYAESPPIRLVREQIRKPDDDIVPMCFCDFTAKSEMVPNSIIALNFGARPYFWVVKIRGWGLLLPAGGVEHSQLKDHLADEDGKPKLLGTRFCSWLPSAFGRQRVDSGRVEVDTVPGDGDLIGLQREEPDEEGKYWIVVGSWGTDCTVVQRNS